MEYFVNVIEFPSNSRNGEIQRSYKRCEFFATWQGQRYFSKIGMFLGHLFFSESKFRNDVQVIGYYYKVQKKGTIKKDEKTN